MRPLVPLAAALALVAACGGEADRAGQGAQDPEAAVLRAADLPRGYHEGDDSGCGVASATEGDWPQLEPLFRETRPRACAVELRRVWAGSGEPETVTSAAFAFRDAQAAERAFAARGELVAFAASVEGAGAESFELGDEAQLVRGDGLNHRAVALVWRAGNVVAMVAVEPGDDDAVRALGRRQQARIEGKLDPPAADDELELELDDPAFELPVYWLGRTFDPPGDLPGLTLQHASVLRSGAGPGNAVKLDYGGDAGEGAFGVTLDLWEPGAWRRFSRTRLGRLVWDSPCARKTTVPVAEGRAEIFEGYGEPRPVRPPCPDRRPDRLVGHVYFEEAVVVVDMPYCYACAAPPPVASPYQTVAGMRAIARSLELRRP